MIKLKILLLGGTGFLGSSIANLVPEGVEFNKSKFDLLDFDVVKEKIQKMKPEVVIHAARINPFDDNPAKAKKVTKQLVEVINLINAKLIYISSDAIFDGRKGNYREDDNPNPLTDYGRAKLIAEKNIKEGLKDYMIIRPSYIYGKSNNGWDKRSLELIDYVKNQKIIYRFKDMYRSPILVIDLARACWKLIEKDFTGTIHLAGKKKSVFQFSQEVIEGLGLDPKFIKPNLLKDISSDIAPDTSLNIDLAKKVIDFN